ncbi:MAG: insulinase family protein [Candidatus Coatesbacteria bacterium]|nr:insulinase family protein [Candidatus Coatesbacteria bacterium]
MKLKQISESSKTEAIDSLIAEPDIHYLKNGLCLVHQRIPFFRSVAIGLIVRVGVRDEHGFPEGISHFIEHILFRGTQKHDVDELSEWIEDLGGHVNASTGREDTAFHVHTLSEYLDQGLDLVHELVTSPKFTLDDIEQEKKVILEEIKESSDQPDELLMDRLYNKLWPRHPLGRDILGTEKSISCINKKSLLDYYKKTYRANRMILGVCGNFESRDLMDLVKNKWTKIPEGEVIQRNIPRWSTKGSFTILRPELTQNQVAIAFKAFPANDHRRLSLAIISSYLGGGMNSLLFKELREKMGLVYSIQTFDSLKSDMGYWIVHFSTSKDTTKKALIELKRLLTEFRRKGFDEDNLKRIKRQFRRNIILSMESLHSRLGFMLRNQMLYNKQISLDKILVEINSIGVAAINKLVKEILPNKGFQIIVGEGEYEPFILD